MISWFQVVTELVSESDSQVFFCINYLMKGKDAPVSGEIGPRKPEKAVQPTEYPSNWEIILFAKTVLCIHKEATPATKFHLANRQFLTKIIYLHVGFQFLAASFAYIYLRKQQSFITTCKYKIG